MEIDNFVNYLLSSSPQNTKSIQLDLDMGDENNSKTLFEMLLELFTKIMNSLYGSNINLDEMSENDFAIVVKYFMSFGIKIIYDINPNDNNNNILIDKNELKDYYLNLKTSKNYYRISFDYL